MKKTLIVIVLLIATILIAIGYFYFFVYQKPHVNYSDSKPDIEISVQELYSDFVSNPLSASKKYNGKIILVKGTIDFIDEIDDMVIAVMVIQEGFFGPEGVRFNLLDNQKELIEINEPILIKGFCAGFTESDVIIEHSTVYK